ncbi:MAG: peptidoglycan bridge formation glycyltransferase FemA/FemB family protein [Bdellovibrionota bacterium]
MNLISAKPFGGDRDLWNRQLSACLNPNIFSTHEWGEYKKTNWFLERVCFFDGDQFIGQTQILFKKLGPFKFGWCSSGINVTDHKFLSKCIEGLESYYNLWTTYIRFNFFDYGTDEAKAVFDRISLLKPVKKPVNSGFTVRFLDMPNWHGDPKLYSQNNRYYLKKARAQGLVFSITPLDIDLFCKVHNAMAETKDLQKLKVNAADISELHKYFGEKLLLAQVSNGTEVIAVALLIRHEKILYYYLAGSSELGRDLNASFLMVDSILSSAKDMGIKEFDFGGIDPNKQSIAGINRFKTGFAGTVVNYVGEKNLCKSKILIRIFDYIISRKLG